MVDMWMLSVAAALIEHTHESDSAALSQVEQAVREVPGLGEALDAARSAPVADRRAFAETLADGLDVHYDESDDFAARLDELWPEVLFGRKRPRAANFINGTVTGTVVQLDSVVGTINLGSAPSPAPAGEPAPPPGPAADRSWFTFRRPEKP